MTYTVAFNVNQEAKLALVAIDDYFASLPGPNHATSSSSSAPSFAYGVSEDVNTDVAVPVRDPSIVQEESRLLNYLMQNYDRDVRPVISHKSTVQVKVGITLTQIFDMVSFCLETWLKTPNSWFALYRESNARALNVIKGHVRATLAPNSPPPQP